MGLNTMSDLETARALDMSHSVYMYSLLNILLWELNSCHRESLLCNHNFGGAEMYLRRIA